MSRRQMHRAGRQTIPYGPEVDRTVIHWSYETRKYTAPAEAADSDLKNRSFAYKAWEADPANSPVVDDGADEPLPLKSTREIVEEAPPTDGGLSASDIRGAVGGEAIPGIASAAAGPKEEPSAEQPSAEQPEQTEQTEQPSAEQPEQAGSEQKELEQPTESATSAEPSGPSAEPSVEPSVEPSAPSTESIVEPGAPSAEMSVDAVTSVSAEASAEPSAEPTVEANIKDEDVEMEGA